MTYPDIDTKTWAKVHRLTLDSHPCSNCGVNQVASIPFETKDWAGLLAPLHGCGEEYRLARGREKSLLAEREWRKVFKKISKPL